MSSLASNSQLTNSKTNESNSFIDPNYIANQSRCATAPIKHLNGGDEEFKYGIQFINLEKSGKLHFFK